MPRWEREVQGQPLWQIDDELITLDGSGVSRYVIATTELQVMPFPAIDVAFARDYGEGDRTLSWFQSDAWDYYSAVCAGFGRTPMHDMPMICERFRVVCRE